MQQSLVYTGGHLLEYIESFAFLIQSSNTAEHKMECVYIYKTMMAMTTP